MEKVESPKDKNDSEIESQEKRKGDFFDEN